MVANFGLALTFSLFNLIEHDGGLPTKRGLADQGSAACLRAGRVLGQAAGGTPEPLHISIHHVSELPVAGASGSPKEFVQVAKQNHQGPWVSARSSAFFCSALNVDHFEVLRFAFALDF